MVKFADLKLNNIYVMPQILPIPEWTNAKGIPFYINEPEALRPSLVMKEWGTSMVAGRPFRVLRKERVSEYMKKAFIRYTDEEGGDAKIIDSMFEPDTEFEPVKGVVEGAKAMAALAKVAKEDRTRFPPDVSAKIGSFLSGEEGPLAAQRSKLAVKMGRPGVPIGGRHTRRRKTAHKKRKTLSKRK